MKISERKAIIDKVKTIAEKTYEKSFLKYHIKLVVKYALKLAKIKGADKEIVEIAAWLHDISWAESLGLSKLNKHHIDSARKAEKILRRLGYPEDKIKRVSNCILSHRGSVKDFSPKTLEEKILKNADAIAHFKTFLDLFAWNMKKRGLEKAVKFLEEKIERDWKKRLTIPEAREMVREEYRAAKILLKNMSKI